LIEAAPVAYIDAPEVVRSALANINTPEEWRQAGSRPIQ